MIGVFGATTLLAGIDLGCERHAKPANGSVQKPAVREVNHASDLVAEDKTESSLSRTKTLE